MPTEIEYMLVDLKGAAQSINKFTKDRAFERLRQQLLSTWLRGVRRFAIW
jgi:hypothetical protein